MRFILTATFAASFSLFAMNVAIETSATVERLHVHTKATNDYLTMLENR